MLQTISNFVQEFTQIITLDKLSELKNKLLKNKSFFHIIIFIYSSLILIGSLTIFGSYFIYKRMCLPFEVIVYQRKEALPKRIILIRHGQTSANLQETIYAHVPNHQFLLIELTQNGIEQALQAGNKLKKIVGDETVRFYVSSFKRTKETLIHILKSFNSEQFNYQEDSRIREQEFGNLEKYQLDKKQRQQVKHERSIVGKFFYRFQNGESGADVYDRCTMFLDTLLRRIDNVQKRKYDNYVIVTHGLLMQLFIMRYFKLSIEQFENLENPNNCAIWVLLKNKEGTYSLESQNNK